MKFTLKKIGPISNATLKLGKMTILSGCNNTGKTYITYALFGFLNSWKKNIKFSKDDEIVTKLLDKGECSIDLTDFKDELQNKSLRETSKIYSQDIHEIFSASEDSFVGATFLASIDELSYNPSKIDAKIRIARKGIAIARKEEKDSELHFFLNTNEPRKSQIRYYLRRFINENIAESLIGNLLPHPFIITSERLGISLFYKELDVNKNVLVDYLVKMSQKQLKNFNPFELVQDAVSRYALPIRMNINFTRDLENIQKQKSFLSEGDNKILKEITQLLGGSYRIQNNNILFISKKKKDGYVIPLFLGSSAVRALSDLYFYLKHSARKNDILIIDEPESHLNPENQIKIARILAKIANSGIKVFISTHSDFIIKEINNLIGLNNNFDKKESFMKKFKYEKSDILNFKDIRVYTAENNGLVECEINKQGIRVPIFDKVIEKLNFISDELEYQINLDKE